MGGRKPPNTVTAATLHRVSTTCTLSLRAKTVVCEPTLIKLSHLSAPFKIRRLEIGNTGRGDWIVSDLRVNGWSQFVIGGDVPGDLFDPDAIDSSFENCAECQAGGSIEIDVCYIGDQAHAELTAILEGTVAHDDSASPPPDLHATLEVEGQRVEIVGTCNWRPPAESDHEA